jgi:hypothetical protein
VLIHCDWQKLDVLFAAIIFVRRDYQRWGVLANIAAHL